MRGWGERKKADSFKRRMRELNRTLLRWRKSAHLGELPHSSDVPEKRCCSTESACCHETVRRFSSRRRWYHFRLRPTAVTAPTRNSNANPNPSQRSAWWVCQLVVAFGKALFAVGAHRSKFACTGSSTPPREINTDCCFAVLLTRVPAPL